MSDPFCTPRFTAAVTYAARVHAGQLRKGTGIPYVSHVLAVCAIAIEDGADEDVAIGALLHDAGEDGGGRETAAPSCATTPSSATRSGHASTRRRRTCSGTTARSPRSTSSGSTARSPASSTASPASSPLWSARRAERYRRPVRRAPLLAVAAALAAAGSALAAPAAGPVSVPMSGPKIARLVRATTLPVLLPRTVRLAGGYRVYVSTAASARKWRVELGGAPGCSANACFLAGLYGFKGVQLPGKPNVTLANGTKAYYRPISCGASCAPAQIWLAYRGTTINFQTKDPVGKPKAALVAMANEALARGPL